MTEPDWLRSTDPSAMLDFVKTRASPRKLRLLAVALARTMRKHLRDDYGASSRRFLRAAERACEGQVKARQLARLEEDGWDEKAWCYFPEISEVDWTVPDFDLDAWAASDLTWACVREDAYAAASDVVDILLRLPPRKAAREAILAARQRGEPHGDRWDLAGSLAAEHGAPARRRLARWVREVFGNPFRPVAFDSAWRTPGVLGLAEEIYEQRGFERLPILADALTDAGCDNEELLAHCRKVKGHARGCWALDVVLGRE